LNNIPADILLSKNFQAFKSRLETVLFNKCFINSLPAAAASLQLCKSHYIWIRLLFFRPR